MKLCVLFFLCSFILSCTTNAVIQIDNDSKNHIYFQTEASEGVSSIIHSFTGTSHTVNIFDKSIIESRMFDADIEQISISSYGTTDVSLSGVSYDLQNLIPSGTQLISVSDTTGGRQLTVLLNEQTLGSLFSFLGEESLLYIELLQAPIFTGEEMTSDEYLEFIGALYGETVLEEMKNSVLTFEVEVPKEIQEAKIEPMSIGDVRIFNQKVIFSVYLYKFLSNKEDVFFRIQWK